MSSKIKIVMLPTAVYSLKNSINYRNFNLFAGYVKSILSQEVKDPGNIEIISQRDADLGGDAYLLNKLADQDTKIVIFPFLMDFDFSRSAYLGELLKKTLPSVKILISGNEISTNMFQHLNDFPFDYAQSFIFSPKVLTEIYRHISYGDKLPETPFIELTGSKKLFYDMPPSRSSQISSIKSPFLNGFLESSFQYKTIGNISKFCCVGGCLYCWAGYYSISPEAFRDLTDLKKELNVFLKKGVNLINWTIDPCINYPPERFEKICKIIKDTAGKGNIRSIANIRVDYIDIKMIKLLKECNFSAVSIGLQTTNTGILSKMKRRTNIKSWLNKVKALNEMEIRTDIEIMLGLPDDNLPSFKNTIDFLVEEDLIRYAGVYLYRMEPVSRLCAQRNKYNIKFQSKAPHLVLNSNNFSFEDIKEGINYAKGAGAVNKLQPYKDNNYPLFTTYFSDGSEKTAHIEDNLPVTKLIINLKSENNILKMVNPIKEKLAKTVTVWFLTDLAPKEVELIKKISHELSKPNLHGVWNIILETNTLPSMSIIRELASSINYKPNNLDYESIYLADDCNNEYYRTSTRFYLLSGNINIINSISSYYPVYLYIGLNSNAKIWELEADGYVVDIPDRYSIKKVVEYMEEINRKNWKKRKILFKNLFHQTLYNLYFNHKYDLEGYEEHIVEINEIGISNRLFSEKLLDGQLPQLNRFCNY